MQIAIGDIDMIKKIDKIIWSRNIRWLVTLYECSCSSKETQSCNEINCENVTHSVLSKAISWGLTTFTFVFNKQT